MIEFLLEHLVLFVLLFVTYLGLEAIEAKGKGALESFLKRARAIGPFVGGLLGAVPQCGFSAVAASLYSGGVITLGTIIAVFLSTSDELIPVLLSAKGVESALVLKIVGIKIALATIVGFTVNAFIILINGKNSPVIDVGSLCEHSHCHCGEHRGILIPALIHTLEIFIFILIVSGSLAVAKHYFGTEFFATLQMSKPVIGEMIASALGLIPNCAVSVAFAQLYAEEVIGAGALMASSFSGCGVGLLVLFRTNRNFKANILILVFVYILSILLGLIGGALL